MTRGLISAHTARSVLYMFGEPDGYEPGSFMRALYDAMLRADKTNLTRLAYGFPEEVAAVRIYREYGPNQLRTYLSDKEQHR